MRYRSFFRRLALPFFALGYLACSQLPLLEEGVCGNRVVDVELGEQCDGNEPNAERTCVPPGFEGACRFQCAPKDPCPTGFVCTPRLICEKAIDICGNGIVEAGEYCDRDEGRECYGSEARCPCRYDCSLKPCPPGEGFCGVDKVCRKADGKWQYDEAAQELTQFENLGFFTADMDGDGREDLVRVARDGYHVHFPGLDFDLSQPLRLPLPPGSSTQPLLVDLADKSQKTPPASKAPRASLGLAFGVPSLLSPTKRSVALVRLNSERRIEKATTSPSYTFTSKPLVFSANMHAKTAADELLVLQDGLATGYRQGLAGEEQAEIFAIPTSQVRGFAAAAFSSSIANPCTDVAVAIQDGSAAKVGLLQPCKNDGEWDLTPGQTLSIAITAENSVFPGSAASLAPAGALHPIDLNGDGHLDLLLNRSASANARPAIAYGLADGSFHSQDPTKVSPLPTTGDGKASAWAAKTTNEPQCPTVDSDGDLRDWVLAVVQHPQSGLLDVVTRRGIFRTTSPSLLRSIACPSQTQPTVVGKTQIWSQAVVADFDGNGHLDIAALKATYLDGKKLVTGSIEFFLGSSNGLYTPYTIPTGGEPRFAVAADFDGDGFADLAFAGDERIDNSTERTLAWISFGATTGPSEPLPIATFDSIDGIQAGRLNSDGTSDLVVASSTTTEDNDTRYHLSTFAGSPSRLLLAPEQYRVMGETQNVLSIASGFFQGKSPQLAVLTDSGNGKAQAWLSTIAAGLKLSTTEPATALDCTGCRSVALDVDNDGVDELVVLDDGDVLRLKVFGWNNGGFQLNSNIELPSSLKPHTELFNTEDLRFRLRAEDLDGDGANDLVYINAQRRLAIIWNDGQLTSENFLIHPAPDTAPNERVRAFDFIGFRNNEPRYVLWALNASVKDTLISSFRTRAVSDTKRVGGEYPYLTAGDLNGDGVDDAVLGNSESMVIIPGEETEPPTSVDDDGSSNGSGMTPSSEKGQSLCEPQ